MSLETTESKIFLINVPEPSDWECHLLGDEGGIVYYPVKNSEPCWFHRWMQRLAFGVVWKKK